MGAYPKYVDTELATADRDIISFVTSEYKRTAGRPAAYPNTAEGLELFRAKCAEFFELLSAYNADKEPQETVFPDVEHWCLHLGLTRRRLLDYAQRGEEWQQAIELAKECIIACKKQLASKGRINAVFAIFDLTNNSDYRNSNCFTLQPAQYEKELPSFEEIQAKLPKDLLKNDDTTPLIEDRSKAKKTLDDFLND